MVHSKLRCFYSKGHLDHANLLHMQTTLSVFLLNIVVSNCEILESRKLELSCLAKIAEGTEVSFHLQIIRHLFKFLCQIFVSIFLQNNS